MEVGGFEPPSWILPYGPYIQSKPNHPRRSAKALHVAKFRHIIIRLTPNDHYSTHVYRFKHFSKPLCGQYLGQKRGPAHCCKYRQSHGLEHFTVRC